MSLRRNPLICDERMKWIQIGEQEEWIKWYTREEGEDYPECSNYQQPWTQISLPGATSCRDILSVLKCLLVVSAQQTHQDFLCYAHYISFVLQILHALLVRWTTLEPCSVRTVGWDSTKTNLGSDSASPVLLATSWTTAHLHTRLTAQVV